jgi:hypothetical protein
MAGCEASLGSAQAILWPFSTFSQYAPPSDGEIALHGMAASLKAAGPAQAAAEPFRIAAPADCKTWWQGTAV